MLGPKENSKQRHLNRKKPSQLTLKSDIKNEEMSMERTAQLNSVLRIISESIEKLKISMILPHIFENPIMLRKFLGETEYKYCISLVEQYIKQKKTESTATIQKPPHLNYRLIKIIDYFHEHFKLLDCIPNWLDDLENDDKSLLEAFQLLENITEERLKKSALSELNKEKKIHEIYHENETINKTILALRRQLKSQRVNLRWKLAAKEGVIKKYEEDLSFRKYDNNVKIKKEIVKSSRSIRQIHAASAIRQKELQEELERATTNYDKLLKDNLKQEKIARDEKNKLLIQLQTLIKKYDQTIGEKLSENANLQDEYEQQKAQFDEFMIEYNREEDEYNRVVRAKEEEEKRQQEQKILLFMMNRAARVIQKRWRRFRRAQRKQAKKGKGKKGKRK